MARNETVREPSSSLQPNPAGKILVVDDQRNMRTTLSMMLRSAGYEVDEAAGGTQGREYVQSTEYDVVITDLRMGEHDGIDVLRLAKEVHPMTEVIVMTAYGTIESAVEAMRLGAFDYIQKPFTEQELSVKVLKGLESRRLNGRVQLFAQDFKDRYHLEHLVGRSAAIRDVFARIVKIAPTDATALITGESGTGKELVARAIHANSKRAERPFITVNCAAISETLLESELFGYARGAFTGAVTSRKGLIEESDGGTFFFDEIAETTMAFQAKLLRTIQEGEVRRVGDNRAIKVDVRVIAATNVELQEAVEAKRFREDLFYRLNVARFKLPPLRERPEDIPLLVDHFLTTYSHKMGIRTRLADGIIEKLQGYPFPGNVRELENMVEQAVALATGGVITLDDILPEAPAHSQQSADRSLAGIVDRAEKVAIEDALRGSSGNREKAATALGISATTLWRKMTRLGVTFD